MSFASASFNSSAWFSGLSRCSYIIRAGNNLKQTVREKQEKLFLVLTILIKCTHTRMYNEDYTVTKFLSSTMEFILLEIISTKFITKHLHKFHNINGNANIFDTIHTWIWSNLVVSNAQLKFIMQEFACIKTWKFLEYECQPNFSGLSWVNPMLSICMPLIQQRFD